MTLAVGYCAIHCSAMNFMNNNLENMNYKQIMICNDKSVT